MIDAVAADLRLRAFLRVERLFAVLRVLRDFERDLRLLAVLRAAFLFLRLTIFSSLNVKPWSHFE